MRRDASCVCIEYINKYYAWSLKEFGLPFVFYFDSLFVLAKSFWNWAWLHGFLFCSRSNAGFFLELFEEGDAIGSPMNGNVENEVCVITVIDSKGD